MNTQEATRLRDVYLRDVAHVQTLEALAEATVSGLRQVAQRAPGDEALQHAKALRNSLQQLRFALEAEVDEQNAALRL
jgi:hypothetical protein